MIIVYTNWYNATTCYMYMCLMWQSYYQGGPWILWSSFFVTRQRATPWLWISLLKDILSMELPSTSMYQAPHNVTRDQLAKCVTRQIPLYLPSGSSFPVVLWGTVSRNNYTETAPEGNEVRPSPLHPWHSCLLPPVAGGGGGEGRRRDEHPHAQGQGLHPQCL